MPSPSSPALQVASISKVSRSLNLLSFSNGDSKKIDLDLLRLEKELKVWHSTQFYIKTLFETSFPSWIGTCQASDSRADSISSSSFTEPKE